MIRKEVNYQDLKSKIYKALKSGAKRDPENRTTVRWDISGNCMNPYIVHHWSRPTSFHDQMKNIKRNSDTRLDLEMKTRCRGCENCRKQRQKLWYARCYAETSKAPRSWFGTLTIAPEHLYHFRLMAQKKVKARSLIWNELSERQKFQKIYAEISPEITRYLKRVRKSSNCHKLRFMLVCEKHKSGNPHFHCVVHQVGAVPLTYRDLSEKWLLGFTNFKLVQSPKVAGYISKYISKSLLCRVRASLKYGNYPYIEDTEVSS